jgi:glucokinase
MTSLMPKFPVLVADIGGTHARFAWTKAPDEPPGYAMTLKVAEFESPLIATQHYLTLLRRTLGEDDLRPRQAAFAVAATLRGDVVKFTNSRWDFSCAAFQRELNVERFLALNDFEALAFALPHLGLSQLRSWGVSSARPAGNLAVLGPGTGLGVAALVKTQAGWQAVPGEGGHATLAPADDFESALLAQVRKSFDHVSAERLLSGVGLPLLHAVILQIKGQTSAEVTAASLVSGALAGDSQASETLHHFCALLGGFAGNVALTFGAQGGLYIGGGIVPRLGDFFFASKFRERFEAKGRYSAYLKDIPVAVITDPDAALLGAVYRLQNTR